jgi:hypothetical protein
MEISHINEVWLPKRSIPGIWNEDPAYRTASEKFYMMINDENMEIGKSFLKGSFPV